MDKVLHTTLVMCCILLLQNSTIAQDDVYLGRWSVRGKVIDRSTEKPIAGAAVILKPTGSRSSILRWTRGDGTFVFDTLKRISFTIGVQKDNYTSYVSGSYALGEYPHALTVSTVFLQRNEITPEVSRPSSSGYTIRGKVVDYNKRPVADARVLLRPGDSRSFLERRTNSDGYFVFDNSKYMFSFNIEVQKDNYNPYVSGSYNLGQNQPIYDVGTIPLQSRANPPDVPPSQPVTVVDTASYIKTTLVNHDILPTNGAKELFYALNPELRNREYVPANYQIKLPDFPRMDPDVEREFNKQFKQDKNKDPDLFSFNNITPPHRTTISPLFATSYIQPVESSILYKASMQPVTESNEQENLPRGLEKFVFVMWKMDNNGNHIEKGPEVEGRFLVYYAGLYKEGDTSTYHRASNATYGFATMAKATYKVIVIDQLTGQQVRISDPIIETNIFFEKKDIFTLINAHPVWYKIPIRVFD